MSAPHVVVIGAGLAGLGASLRCADEGLRVTLLEARRRLGGATWSLQRGGLWVDNGQHVFLRCCTAYRGFLERLGVEDRTEIQSRLDVRVASPDGRSARLGSVGLPAPLHLAPSVLGFCYLRPAERVRAGLAARALAMLDPRDPTLDEMSFGAWLRERGQSPTAIRTFWDLLVVATLNTRCEKASLALATKVFQTGLLEAADAADIGWSRVPLQRLHADPAERELRRLGVSILPGKRVRSIVGARAGAEDGALTAVLDDGALVADAVIVAAPHHDAARMLPAAAGIDRASLESLGSSAIVNLHVVLDRRVMRVPFTAGVETPLQWVFDRSDSSGLSSGRDAGQYLAVSLSDADALLELSSDELHDRFVPELARLFPDARAARVREFFVTREPRATFRQAPGSRRCRPGPRTACRGLYLAGAWTDTGWPATMEGAVRSGVAAARAVVDDVGHGTAAHAARAA